MKVKRKPIIIPATPCKKMGIKKELLNVLKKYWQKSKVDDYFIPSDEDMIETLGTFLWGWNSYVYWLNDENKILDKAIDFAAEKQEKEHNKFINSFKKNKKG